MVSTASIITMAFCLLAGIGLPTAFILVILKIFKLRLRPFWIGCAVWVIFAIVLEQIFHKLVLGTPTGSSIKANVLWMALYGGLAAGIFEETGRFLAIRHTLKKEQANDMNALSYGMGHGGCEAAFILIFGMINNILCAILINTGTTGLITASLNAEQTAAAQKAFETLINTPPASFLASPAERITAILLHISLSVIVWFAVTRRKIYLYPIAILLHASVDSISMILTHKGLSIWLIESIILVMTVAVAAAAFLLWKTKGRMCPEYMPPIQAE